MKTKNSKTLISPLNFSDEEEFIKVVGHLLPPSCSEGTFTTTGGNGGGSGSTCSPSVLFQYPGGPCLAVCSANGDCSNYQNAGYYCTDCTVGIGAGCNMGGCVTQTNVCSSCSIDSAESGCLYNMQILDPGL